MISSLGVRAWHKILGSLALSVQNQGPTVQPNGNAIVDTICRTPLLHRPRFWQRKCHRRYHLPHRRTQ
ncbi:hypothetical protein A6J36_01760 [Corynebacterium diphtheriae]|nr:hypothetical protein A6J36_01760 [Corynebacterium diphtheriae]